MKNCPISFDYQSSSPCEREVLDEMKPYWSENWGNPSSKQNRVGIHASAAINLAREKIATSLEVKPEHVIFTSGATESNNLAILGFARANQRNSGRFGHLLTMSTEHHAVLEPMRELQKEGFKLTEIKPNSDGLISLNNLKNNIVQDTILASFMMANNEIGVVHPIKEICDLCHENNIILHSDASQAIGLLPIKEIIKDIDLISISSHKIYGPKGVGALIIKNNIELLPIQFGGGQENGLRPGTIPVPLIVGFAKAVEISVQQTPFYSEKIGILRDKLLEGLQKEIPKLLVNGSMENRLPNNLNVSFMGVNGNRLHREIRPFISCTSGSACSNGEPSHVLLEIGRDFKEAEASLRLSLGRSTTEEEVQKAVQIISGAIKKITK